MSQTITIFLASSAELKDDREKFEQFIGRKNKTLIEHDRFIKLVIWEDFNDAMSQTRLQDEYNKTIRECDIFVMLFHTKMGKYIREEFETAYRQFQESGKPHIYTYFKTVLVPLKNIPREDIQNLWDFQDRFKVLGHFWTEYDNSDQLINHFSGQLEKLNLFALDSQKARTNYPLPCHAYTGKEPYLFISYAHVDGYRVYPEIKMLADRGYRIWYDEGIAPTEEWLKEIALAINGSIIFIIFITPDAIQSYYVNKEVKYAINERKLLLPVYLEEVSLPMDWKLGMGDIQAIMKWEMPKDDYTLKILKALPDNCLEKSERVLTQEIAISYSQNDKPVVEQPFLHINKFDPTTINTRQEFHIPDGMVFVRGGIFLMGSPENEAGRGDNETQHRARVHDFCMAKYLVTLAQFESFIKESNYWTDADKDGSSFISYRNESYKRSGVNWRCDPEGEFQKDKQHPVIHVSWNDVSAYCKWMSEKFKKNYRLPTEAEWEYACRAGTTTPFNTGTNLTMEQANFNVGYSYHNYPRGKKLGKTTPVSSYPPNGCGLYDLHGNVWEWCLDWYDEKYYDECKQRGIVDNPQGPETGSNHVMRGGSWNYDLKYCRSACRQYYYPSFHYFDGGFRLVFLP